MTNRYRDAYRLAKAIVLLSDTVKSIGYSVAVIMALSGLVSGSGAIAVTVCIAAAMVAAIAWIVGVIVGSQGNILMATLDGAVAVSPFMTNDEKREAMGLDALPSANGQASQTRAT